MVKQTAKYFIIMSMACMSFLHAKKNSQEIFLKANKEYEQRHFKKAHDLYESLDQKGRAVWYNLGNCAYYLQQYPKAVVYWKRAQEGASAQEQADIEANLAVVYKKMGKEDQPKFWYDYGVQLPLPPFILQLLLVVVWYILLWLLFFGSMARTPKYYVLLFCMILAVGVLSVEVYRLYKKERSVIGIVTKKKSALLAGPRTDYHVLKSLEEIEQLVVYDERPGWYKVSIGDTYGWISADDIAIV